MLINRKKIVLQFVLFLTVLFAFSVSIDAQPNTEKVRQAAITPEKLSASFAEVARTVESAVVNIDTKGKIPDVSIKDDEKSTIPEICRIYTAANAVRVIRSEAVLSLIKRVIF